jgi:CHAT domain-containing protein
LPFSGDVTTVATLVPAARRRVLRGFDATPAALRRTRINDYAVLHFSTHAIVDHDIPEMSRIALSLVDDSGRPVDGYLRPYEISQWKLEGCLVVLAACETAQGKQVMGEGVLGLSSSLLHAGASQLIAAVAAIDDEASARFFDHVYQYMLGSRPVSAARALALARRDIARNPRWSDPYYWAAFELTGRPSL